MDYLDMIRDMAGGSGEIDPTEARAIVNGAEEELKDLKAKVSERFPEEEGAPDTDRQRKPKSEYSRSEKADFFAEQREKGRDPYEEWKALPE